MLTQGFEPYADFLKAPGGNGVDVIALKKGRELAPLSGVSRTVMRSGFGTVVQFRLVTMADIIEQSPFIHIKVCIVRVIFYNVLSKVRTKLFVFLCRLKAGQT